MVLLKVVTIIFLTLSSNWHVLAKTNDYFLKITSIKWITDIQNVENASHIDVNQDSWQADTIYGINTLSHTIVAMKVSRGYLNDTGTVFPTILAVLDTSKVS